MTTPNHPGMFVVFEGGDGSGKGTQIAALNAALVETGRTVTLTREPGPKTVIGEAVRALLLDPETVGLDPRAEALLYAADRAQHSAALLRPALERGEVVISDRYMMSSIAYQGIARNLGATDVEHLSLWGTGNLVPDLTVLLDVDPEKGLARAGVSEFGVPDRLEAEGIAFHRAVREAFLSLAAAAPARHLVLDATQRPEAVAAAVWASIKPLLSVSGSSR